MIKEAIAKSSMASPGQLKTIKGLNAKVSEETLANLTAKQASAMLTALFALSAKKKKEDGKKKKK